MDADPGAEHAHGHAGKRPQAEGRHGIGRSRGRECPRRVELHQRLRHRGKREPEEPGDEKQRDGDGVVVTRSKTGDRAAPEHREDESRAPPRLEKPEAFRTKPATSAPAASAASSMP